MNFRKVIFNLIFHFILPSSIRVHKAKIHKQQEANFSFLGLTLGYFQYVPKRKVQ